MQQMAVESQNDFQTNGKLSNCWLFHEHLKRMKQLNKTAGVSSCSCCCCWFTLQKQQLIIVQYDNYRPPFSTWTWVSRIIVLHGYWCRRADIKGPTALPWGVKWRRREDETRPLVVGSMFWISSSLLSSVSGTNVCHGKNLCHLSWKVLFGKKLRKKTEWRSISPGFISIQFSSFVNKLEEIQNINPNQSPDLIFCSMDSWGTGRWSFYAGSPTPVTMQYNK